MDNYSAFKGEQEVVIYDGTRLKVKDVIEIKQGMQYI
jgi:hypothetical protein